MFHQWQKIYDRAEDHWVRSRLLSSTSVTARFVGLACWVGSDVLGQLQEMNTLFRDLRSKSISPAGPHLEHSCIHAP